MLKSLQHVPTAKLHNNETDSRKKVNNIHVEF